MPWSTRDLVLAGSVAVNLVLAGFVVGAGVRLAGDGGRPDPRAFDAPIGPRAGLELTDEQRRAMREAFEGAGLRAAPLFRELREARDAFETAVRAEPFDADGARAALARIRTAETQLRERSNDVMITILSDLPADERAQMLEGMRDAGRRFRGRDRRAEPDESPPLEDQPPR
jgi:uncharacterized membrane protein